MKVGLEMGRGGSVVGLAAFGGLDGPLERERLWEEEEEGDQGW